MAKEGSARPAEVNVDLPAALVDLLIEETRLGKVTALKRSLEEVEALGPEASQLVGQLRQKLREYDMDGILKTLERLK